MGPTLETITAVFDWRVTSLGRDCAARHGKNDPLVERLALAWNEADRRGEWTKPHDLRSTQVRDVFAKHGVEKLDRQTAVKVGLGALRKRETQPDTDKT